MKVRAKINKNTTKKKIIITSSIVGVLCLVGYLVYANNAKIFPFQLADAQPGEFLINLDKSESEKAKTQEIEENPEQKVVNDQKDTPAKPSIDDSGKQEALVMLSYASIQNNTVTASGYVSNITEAVGDCTYTFSRGGQIVTKKTQALQNPTSTTCTTASFPAAELESGKWSVTLSYSSEKSQGVSALKEIIKQ